MKLFKKNEKKATQKLPMTGRMKKNFRRYCMAVLAVTMVFGTSMTAFAANDPIAVVNNLSNFIFGLIKAVGMIMQESGGKGNDPMQAAEGSFNKKYPHEPNGIKDPEYSIECGVQELKAALTSAEVENPIDMERIKHALQGYNFGNGYISWAKTNYGGYSYANAVEFSAIYGYGCPKY